MARSSPEASLISGSTLDAALRTLSEVLLERIPRSVEDGLEVMRREAPSYFIADDDPAFVDLYNRSYADHLAAVWKGLSEGPDVAPTEPPVFALGEATAAAQMDIPLEALLHTFRIAHRLMLDEAMEEAEQHIPDTDVRRRVIAVTHQWLFLYFDRITPAITQAYQQERDGQFRGRERRRRQLTRRLLAGDSVDERQLGYTLRQEHIALIAWGMHADQAITSLAAATGNSMLITVGSENSAWGWLGGDPLRLPRTDALTTHLPEGTHLALGTPCRGIDGFRRTHRHALEAHRIGRLLDWPIARFEEVELLALTTHDLQLARDFIARWLGPLAEPGDRAGLLRETLRVYFDTGQNAAAAGAKLQVNDRTIAYRVRTIEERLGASIVTQHDELSLALRLFATIGTEPR